jgi:ribosomal subunit interface protein
MNIQITGRNVRIDATLKQFVERRLEYSIGRFAKRITDVYVRLADVNGPRGGLDQHCRLTIHLHPRGEILVEDRTADMESAITQAASRAGQVVRRELERRRTARVRRAATAA